MLLTVTFLAAGVLGQTPSTITPASCAASNLVANGNFEADGQSGRPGYWYMVPTSWAQSSTRTTILIQQGNRPWGRLRSGSGAYYMGLQRAGAALSQAITGLTVGNRYTLTFKSAERPGYGAAERLTVSMGGVPLITNINPLTAFRVHIATFTATSASMALQFRNSAPAAANDATAFIDDVSICPVPTPGCVAINNPDFEVNAHGGNFVYMTPTGWTTQGSVVALNGNGPWGGLNSGNGAYYLVLQRNTAFARQTMNLTAGVRYSISFLAAERPGYTITERVGVQLNGAFIAGGAAINVNPHFLRYSLTFTAAAVNVITFKNTATSSADTAVFLDGVTICAVPTTAAPTPSTTSTTTTVTHVTDTVVALTLSALRADLITSNARIQALETTLSTYGTLSTLVATTVTNQVGIVTRIGAITGAISAAISLMPPASPAVQGPNNGQGPSIEKTSTGNLLISGNGNEVQAQGTCGIFNLCDLLNALEGLRSVPV